MSVLSADHVRVPVDYSNATILACVTVQWTSEPVDCSGYDEWTHGPCAVFIRHGWGRSIPRLCARVRMAACWQARRELSEPTGDADVCFPRPFIRRRRRRRL